MFYLCSIINLETMVRLNPKLTAFWINRVIKALVAQTKPIFNYFFI